MHTLKRPQLGDCFEFSCAGSHRRCNHLHQIYRQTVKGIWSSDPQNLGMIRWSLLQQCKYYRATL